MNTKKFVMATSVALFFAGTSAMGDGQFADKEKEATPQAEIQDYGKQLISALPEAKEADKAEIKALNKKNKDEDAKATAIYADAQAHIAVDSINTGLARAESRILQQIGPMGSECADRLSQFAMDVLQNIADDKAVQKDVKKNLREDIKEVSEQVCENRAPAQAQVPSAERQKLVHAALPGPAANRGPDKYIPTVQPAFPTDSADQ